MVTFISPFHSNTCACLLCVHVHVTVRQGVESAHVTELRGQISKLSSDASLQKEKYRKLKQDYTEAQSMCYAHEANNHSLNSQVNELSVSGGRGGGRGGGGAGGEASRRRRRICEGNELK
jgi:hypothetical protein